MPMFIFHMFKARGVQEAIGGRLRHGPRYRHIRPAILLLAIHRVIFPLNASLRTRLIARRAARRARDLNRP